MIKKLVLVLTLILPLLACESNSQKEFTHEDSEESRVKNTVILYNSLLADGYRKHDMTGLIEAATEGEATKVFYHMAALTEARVGMEPKLQEIKFEEIKIHSPDAADVLTNEKWDYVYIDVDSKEQVYDNSVAYRLKYNVIRKEKRWVVASVTIESVKEKKSEKFEIFQEPERNIHPKGNVEGESGE